jgi:hypothetical protein
MGYDVHITRKACWWDDAGPVISEDEWQTYLDSDSEMRLDGYAEASTPSGDTLRLEDPGIAVWTAHPRLAEHGGWIQLDSHTGNIVVTNPDDAFLAKMWTIAQALQARVVGDENEEYGPDGQLEISAKGAR